MAVSLLLLFTIIFSWATIRRHDGFETFALDLAKFDQAIWNTAHGWPFRITLGEHSVLQSHFSPALALYAPLFWLWPDIRLLFILQSIIIAGAGFLLYWYSRAKQPWLGLGVYAAYLMHPAVQQVTLVGFHRLTLAMVAISFTLYCLLERRYGWMILGLIVSLLCREDLALAWVVIGLYVTILHRSPKVGVPLLVVGATYLVVVPFAVLPALNGNTGYVHAEAYFAYLGSTLSEIAHSLLSRPGLLLKYPLRHRRLVALWRFLWPTVFLFALAPEIVAFSIPYLAYLLMSSSDAMGRLQNWYPSIALIFLFWAVAVGVSRLPRRGRAPAVGLLLAACFGGWLLYGQLWPGKAFSSAVFQVTEHDRQVDAVLQHIPPQEVVAAQDRLVPHLSHREQIYLFPWMPPKEDIDLFAFDLQSGSTYPLSPKECMAQFYSFLADPDYEIAYQIDDFYLFRHRDAALPAAPRRDCWGNIMTLTGYSVTVAGSEGTYQDSTASFEMVVRVELYWRAEQVTPENYSVALHVIDSQSQIVTQDDSWPVDGERPTSGLEPGTRLRDVHYVSWAGPLVPAELSLRVGLYDAETQQSLLLPDGQPFIVVPLVQEGQKPLQGS